MILIENNLIILDEWLHDPNIVDRDGRTVAMLMALSKKY